MLFFVLAKDAICSVSYLSVKLVLLGNNTISNMYERGEKVLIDQEIQSVAQ